MTWNVFGQRFESGELSDLTMFQPYKPKRDMVLRAVRSWFIVYNAPTFTDLTMHLYSNDADDGSDKPLELIATSTNTWDLADITTLDSANKEIYFNFPYVSINEETTYNFVMSATGYIYLESSHLAWRKAWPDPIYTAGYTPTTSNMGRAPFEISLIGADF